MSEAPEPLVAPALSEMDGVVHGFFPRRGGVSEGIYDSLNCGYGSNDDRGAVRENRGRAIRALGQDDCEAATAYQIHSNRVVEVEGAWEPGEGPRADGMVTVRRGLPIGILTADCAPVLFADAEAGVAGAAHAGWRGAVDGIVEATIDAMIARGARRERIGAAVGPCIGPQSYEVGSEFPRPFLDQDAANSRFFRPAARAGHYLFDLPGYVEYRLQRLDLARVSVVARDTCAEAGEFFSYRRTCHDGGGDYGRNLSLIMLRD
ncbi:MAG: peptidoglycan editing factor PgeF [Alphaproteobacteria bacterium]|nr:peptidoglycan editing factor PgeF [Alphaproteobacteria bacterium]